MKSHISKFLLIALMMLPATMMAQTDSAAVAEVAEAAESPIVPLDTVWVMIDRKSVV